MSRLARVIIAAIALSGLAACGPETPPQPTPATPTTPATTTTTADPARDLGAGTPGAFCATSRLGKRFTHDGVVYQCRGPKPYKWRRADG